MTRHPRKGFSALQSNVDDPSPRSDSGRSRRNGGSRQQSPYLTESTRSASGSPSPASSTGHAQRASTSAATNVQDINYGYGTGDGISQSNTTAMDVDPPTDFSFVRRNSTPPSSGYFGNRRNRNRGGPRFDNLNISTTASPPLSTYASTPAAIPIPTRDNNANNRNIDVGSTTGTSPPSDSETNNLDVNSLSVSGAATTGSSPRERRLQMSGMDSGFDLHSGSTAQQSRSAGSEGTFGSFDGVMSGGYSRGERIGTPEGADVHSRGRRRGVGGAGGVETGRRSSSVDVIRRSISPAEVEAVKHERSAAVAKRMMAVHEVMREHENDLAEEVSGGDASSSAVPETPAETEFTHSTSSSSHPQKWRAFPLHAGESDYEEDLECDCETMDRELADDDGHDGSQNESEDHHGRNRSVEETDDELDHLQSEMYSASIADSSGNARGLPQACLFVASLSSARTDDQLLESVTRHFEKWGALSNVKVLKDWLARPYAFVQFERVEDANKALTEAHNTIIDNRHIRVEHARVNRTLFIAKFSRTQSESHVRGILEKFGPLEDLTLLQNYQTGRSKNCGFVKYCFREDAIKAFLSLRQNYKWVVEWASNLDRGNVEMDTKSIFVGQLNQNEVTPELVEKKFGKYGEIENCQLVNRYPTGPNTRPAFAFITFSQEFSAQNSIEEENGKVWLERTIRVQYRETGDVRPTVPPPPRIPVGSVIGHTGAHHAIAPRANAVNVPLAVPIALPPSVIPAPPVPLGVPLAMIGSLPQHLASTPSRKEPANVMQTTPVATTPAVMGVSTPQTASPQSNQSTTPSSSPAHVQPHTSGASPTHGISGPQQGNPGPMPPHHPHYYPGMHPNMPQYGMFPMHPPGPQQAYQPRFPNYGGPGAGGKNKRMMMLSSILKYTPEFVYAPMGPYGNPPGDSNAGPSPPNAFPYYAYYPLPPNYPPYAVPGGAANSSSTSDTKTPTQSPTRQGQQVTANAGSNASHHHQPAGGAPPQHAMPVSAPPSQSTVQQQMNPTMHPQQGGQGPAGFFNAGGGAGGAAHGQGQGPMQGHVDPSNINPPAMVYYHRGNGSTPLAVPVPVPVPWGSTPRMQHHGQNMPEHAGGSSGVSGSQHGPQPRSSGAVNAGQGSASMQGGVGGTASSVNASQGSMGPGHGLGIPGPAGVHPLYFHQHQRQQQHGGPGQHGHFSQPQFSHQPFNVGNPTGVGINASNVNNSGVGSRGQQGQGNGIGQGNLAGGGIMGAPKSGNP
ncbi:hypothetical protein HDU76_011354 [Blyttiomyces sp. JEL0837]|nr:hypothetical protein HDU76_011354 [Blyttiomyces sp. JEL0837]